jgi:hypothetical protein
MKRSHKNKIISHFYRLFIKSSSVINQQQDTYKKKGTKSEFCRLVPCSYLLFLSQAA